jgi:hypothetical protein
MSSTSRTLKRLGVGSVGAITFLATPYMAGAALAAAPVAGTPASITIASQSTGTGSTRNDGTNTTVKISATVTPAGTGQPAIASVRFSYQSTVVGSPVTVIGTDTTAPYSIEWAPPAAGTYSEIAEALDSTGTPIANNTATPVAVADVSSVHITSPAEGTAVGTSGGNIVVSGTRSSDLPQVDVTAQTRSNDSGALTSAGAATTVAQGTPAAGADQTWSVAVVAPACPVTASTGCDVVITAVATGTGVNGMSDEVTEAGLYTQTLTTFTVTPATATRPAGAPQTYTVTAQDQNAKPIQGLTVNVTANTGATVTPATGTTGTDGTFKFVGQDGTAETTTFTVKSQVGATFDPAVDFTRTATLTTYASTPTTLTLSASPAKSLYAAPSEYTASTSVASPGTPVVDVCVVDQNGNGTPNAASAPANLITTVTRTSTAGTTVTGPDTTTVVPVQDTRTGKANCYLIPHAAAAGDFGQDVFNAYFENNGTPGFQAGSSDVAAGALTLKWATLTITGEDTQAQTGTTATVRFVVAGPNGSPFANRKITLGLSGTDAAFPTTQPSGTTYTGPGAAVCVTDASGVCTVSVTDTTAGGDVVTATDDITDATINQIATGDSDSAAVDFRAQSVKLTLADKGTSYALFPTGSNYDAPGTAGVPIVDTYTLSDVNGGALANTAVTVTTDHGFFTPPPTTAGDYTTLTFNPAIADGAAVGNLKSLGTTFTGRTDASGQITLAVGIGRDAGFDDDGNVTDKLTFAANGGTNVVNNPADWNQPGVDFEPTWTTNNGGWGYQPLNGASVKLLPASATDKISGDVAVPAGTDFVVHQIDQFGNLVRTCNVALTASGAGTLSDNSTCGSFTNANQLTTENLSAPSATATTAGASSTVTATWAAPVTTFKNTAVAPATPSYTTVSTTANKTDSFTVNLYKVDLSNLQYSFVSTPGNTVPVNTAVTTSATVKDQKGNPVQGLCVRFLRSGPGSQSGEGGANDFFGDCTIVTNAQGKAGYSYSSTSAGTATVTVIVSDDSGNELSRGVQNVTFTSGTPTSQVPTISVNTQVINVGKSFIVTVHGKPGDTIKLYALARPATTYQLVNTVRLPASGVWSRSLSPRTTTLLFARSAAGSSRVIGVNVRMAVSLAGSASGRTGTFTGTIVPGHGNVTVRIFTVKLGRLTLVGTTRTAANGHYTFRHTFAAAGTVTFIAQTLSDRQNLAGQSNRVTVTFR